MSANPSEERSRLAPEPVTRRDVLGLLSMGTAVAALGFAALGALRLPRAAVSAAPSKKYKVTLPASWTPGAAFMPPGRSVALFRDDDGVYAVSMICTHLGCIVKATTEGFECPCHGSRFQLDGAVKQGPAPHALPWYQVGGADGAYVIDEGTTVPAGTKVPA